MRRSDLEHVIRAASDISGEKELVIIGSQAILGQYPEAPPDLTMSMEVDLWPKNKPELADKIDGAIGEGSRYHETHGYYAQGVGPETAKLPTGWESRLIAVENPNTDPGRGLCLEPHDLAISKYVAGREKDLEFTAGMIRSRMLDKQLLLDRLETVQIDEALRRHVKARIERQFALRTPN